MSLNVTLYEVLSITREIQESFVTVISDSLIAVKDKASCALNIYIMKSSVLLTCIIVISFAAELNTLIFEFVL